MVAILVDSKQGGRTGRVATRGLARVKVSGISGCVVSLDCFPAGGCLVIDRDGEYDLPEGTEFVSAEHSETTGDSKVFVDLVR